MPLDALTNSNSGDTSEPKKQNSVVWILLVLIAMILGVYVGYKYSKTRTEAELAKVKATTLEQLSQLQKQIDSKALASVRLYFVKDRKTIPISRKILEEGRKSAEQLTLEELLNGPTDEEKALGVASLIPDGSVLLGIKISDKVATVTFSHQLGLTKKQDASLVRSQIVSTLKEFDTVDTIVIKIEGIEDANVL